MLSKIKKVKFEPELKNPTYKVLLECPHGNRLFLEFDYKRSKKKFIPSIAEFRGANRGARLDWYTRRVENMTVDTFLEQIATKINNKYKFEMVK